MKKLHIAILMILISVTHQVESAMGCTLAPPKPGVISVSGGIATVCPGETRTYSIAAVRRTTSYLWTAPIGATIQSGQNTTSIVLAFDANFTSNGTLSVNASNSCGTSSLRTLVISRNIPPTPSVISGSTSVSFCVDQAYSITPLPGVTSYSWTVPNGSAIVSGDNTSAISVHFGSSSGNITVKGVNTCGSGQAQALAVTNTAPSVSGLNATNIATTAAQLNWTALPDVSGYHVQYKALTASLWTTAYTSTSTVAAASLTASTNYEFQVQAVCGSSAGAFSTSSYFTTLANAIVNPPSSLTYTTANASSASINWAAVNGAISYNVQYRLIGGSWNNASTPTNSVTLSGLSSGRTHEWKVQTVGQSSSSGFSTPSSFTTLQSTQSADSLITVNSVWKYLDNGTDQGTAWKGTSFNDGTWASGTAELGYGDGDEATVVSYGPNSSAKYITTYFRKTINITDPAAYSSIALNLVRDDGAVVYVNGTEVFRTNLPTGTISYNTLAPVAIGGTDETTYINTSISPSFFTIGTNTIAVEIHQNLGTSSDISFKMGMAGVTGSSVSLLRRPYLQMLSTNAVNIRWRTDVATNSRVRYGTDLSYSGVVDSSTVTTEHEVRITGLTAGTKYYYTIGSTTIDLSGDSSYYVKTSLPTGSTNAFRIWATGDFGNNSAGQDAVRTSYENYTATSKPADLWLWLGDNAYNTGSDAEFTTNVFAKYPKQFKNTPLFPCLGNHDYGDVGYQTSSTLGTNFAYFNSFSCPTNAQSGGVASGTEKYYSFNYGNVHFITLDSYGSYNTSGSPMYNWLQSDLAANTQRWTVVSFHHPPYTMGTHNSDNDIELKNMRQNIVPLLETYKVDLVLCGHSHVYERSILLKGNFGLENSLISSMKVDSSSGLSPYYNKSGPNYYGTVYAVVGVSGQGGSVGTQTSWPHAAMYSYAKTLYGSLIADFNGDTLDAKFLTSTGSIYDQFKIVKSNSTRMMSLNENSTGNNIQIYPNPFTDQTTIDYRFTDISSTVTLEITDVTGKLHYSSTVNRNADSSARFVINKTMLDNISGFFFASLISDSHIEYRTVEVLK